jgi:hypothetical protein
MVSFITSDEVTRMALRIRSRFLVPFPLDACINGVLEPSQSLPVNLKQPIEAFCEAIIAIHATTSLPYQLASSRSFALHFQRFHMAEKIRSLKGGIREQRKKRSLANKMHMRLHAKISVLSGRAMRG